MKPKHIVTAALLVFVAASVVFLVMKERRPGTPGTVAPAENAPGASTSIVVYYFHGTRRCPTCHKLEEYAREAVMTAFAEDVAAGTIAWQTINTDEPGNEHYVKDYVLSTKSVILSSMAGGKETRWKNLPRIWDLVGDKAAYIAYIQDEIRTFREGG